MTGEKWMAVSVVANRLNVSVATVYRLVEERHLRSRRVGVKGCVQVSGDSVRKFIAARASEEW
jgi:excisionase family DNA binding protein